MLQTCRGSLVSTSSMRQEVRRIQGKLFHSNGGSISVNKCNVYSRCRLKVTDYPTSLHFHSFHASRSGVEPKSFTHEQQREAILGMLLVRRKQARRLLDSRALLRQSIFRSFSKSTKEDGEENAHRQQQQQSQQSAGDTTTSSRETDFAASNEIKSRPESATKGDNAKQIGESRSKQRIRWIDPDRELYKQIHKIQMMTKERSRLRTATNVHRALWGNLVICTAKLGAWMASGSSGMLAEFIHSVVDCGNQALLLVGLRDSRMVADRTHPYGYGKSVYFWALVSALGTFFLGAGVSMTHAIGDLMNPSLQQITWHVWGVLGLSLAVDGYVLKKTIEEIIAEKPADITLWQHINNIRDPATLAVLLEDGAACLGVLLASGGIVASHATGNPVFDALAGVGISGLLGAMGLMLVRMNHRFLLGQAVNREITDDIERILLSRRSIDSIGSVQSQWTGPETFSYKAEVDFDGTYLAAKLMPIYQQEFLKIRNSMDKELQVLLALYAEDVMRAVEREVRHVETIIRKKYPGAEFIELEPMSVDVDRLAIDDNLEADLRRVESDALNRFLKTLRSEEASASQQTRDTEKPSEGPAQPDIDK